MTSLGSQQFPAPTKQMLRSDAIDQQFQLFIAEPPFVKKAEALPVVYSTDGNSLFPLLHAISLMMQRTWEWQPFLLVSIGYPGDQPNAGAILRLRDYVDETCPDCSGPLLDIPGVAKPPPGSPRFGQASAFRAFFANEVLPFVEKRYPCTSERTYFGHSFGGTFGMLDLISDTPLFDNYVLSSPALAYDGTTAAGQVYRRHRFMFAQLDAFRAQAALPRDCRLFLSAGECEDAQAELANWQFTTNVSVLRNDLTRMPVERLAVRSRIMPERSHVSVIPDAFISGMNDIFSDRARMR